ncbi:serine/threonine-protein kinase [Mycolicibacterium fluoranthenivorans]|uniref:non-specific serine/threonine protein kinase n=2 Tax=Mycolicibacterium fluoranthenivorans TaxID=258505 RepID=A0A7X5U304_9MYCO|nr:serine/threonine-protein kinase [Mycolicibacterium fluoranthenivorans]
MDTYQRADPLVGTLLDGRYRVDGPIASGGMSTVYRGLDVRLDRPVALKVMDSRYSGDHQFLTRFQREAKAVARLKDPALVAVYDQGGGGASRQAPFLVMELVEGGTLRELLSERGPMPPHAVAAVLTPLCRGLAVAHAAGLVHRDIKPENVLISDAGEVKIADFGLVRAVAEAGITSTSVILGTAAYLSPEQVGTGESTPRSDVYAVGVLAYELLTGVTPFTGDTALTVAYQRMDRDVPPPSAAIAGVPRQFDELVGRATDRDPAARYADAGDMADALAEVIDELRLPPFRVPAPQQSAQHRAATMFGAQTTHHVDGRARTAHVPNPTREYGADFADELSSALAEPETEPEYAPVPTQFAGIAIDDFEWARQRARRAALIWLLVLVTLTGMVAAGAWTLGSNLPGLLN